MNLGMSDLGPGSEFLKDFLPHYHGASARTWTPPFWLSCWKVPLVWGPHIIWDYLLPSFVEVIISATSPNVGSNHTHSRNLPGSSPSPSHVPHSFHLFIKPSSSWAVVPLLTHLSSLTYLRVISATFLQRLRRVLFLFSFTEAFQGFKALSLSFEFGMDDVNHLMGIVIIFFSFSRRDYSQQSLGLARRRQPDISR